MPVLLGTLPVFRRLPSGGRLSLCSVLRLHSRMALILPCCLLRARQRAQAAQRHCYPHAGGGLVMTASSPAKLLPRNISALRKGRDPSTATRTTLGNPISTRLESGIGNFFPGLECDLRNLERRFFPFLEVDTDFTNNEVFVVSVNVQGAADANAAGRVSAA